MKKLLSKGKALVLWARQLCHSHRKSAIAARVLVLGLPPALWAYANAKFAILLPLQSELVAFATAYPWVPLAAMVWPLLATLVIEVVSDVADAWAGSGDAKVMELVALVTAIDDIVVRKLRRFGDFAKKLRQGHITVNVFSEITQPDKQIKALVQSLRQTLATLTCWRTEN